MKLVTFFLSFISCSFTRLYLHKKSISTMICTHKYIFPHLGQELLNFHVTCLKLSGTLDLDFTHNLFLYQKQLLHVLFMRWIQSLDSWNKATRKCLISALNAVIQVLFTLNISFPNSPDLVISSMVYYTETYH